MGSNIKGENVEQDSLINVEENQPEVELTVLVKQSEEESTVYKEVNKALHEQISQVKDESIKIKGENVEQDSLINVEENQPEVESTVLVKQSEEETTVYKEVTKALHEPISEVKD